MEARSTILGRMPIGTPRGALSGCPECFPLVFPSLARRRQAHSRPRGAGTDGAACGQSLLRRPTQAGRRVGAGINRRTACTAMNRAVAYRRRGPSDAPKIPPRQSRRYGSVQLALCLGFARHNAVKVWLTQVSSGVLFDLTGGVSGARISYGWLRVVVFPNPRIVLHGPKLERRMEYM